MTGPLDEGILDFSNDFVLSSGTVPIDYAQRLVLLLYYRPKGEYLLPKGRKNAGETMAATAVRETMEESCYHCRLLGHHLPTRAPHSLTSPHTEPIAIQQRFHDGIRKIIFWYVAQVNSTDRQIPHTQEVGEDFDVRWVPVGDAPSTMTFAEDRRIVETAIRAIPWPPTVASSIGRLREWYLDPSVNVRALGFLCISLGGSVVCGQPDIMLPQEPGSLRDWDGVGIVDTKQRIVALINEHKSELCTLLRITKEECPSLKVPENSTWHEKWDVLRFSGWTKQGSKRTIKIWSLSSLREAASGSIPSELGVLSHKVAPFTPRDHPTLGPRLFIHQPTKATDQLHILRDMDFLEGSESDKLSSSNHRLYKAVNPGVSCNLFLTSLCLFEDEPGLLASFKAPILQKWRMLSGAENVESIIHLFYRAATFGHSYRQKLRAEFADVDSITPADVTRTNAFARRFTGQSLPTAVLSSSTSLGERVPGSLGGYYQALYVTPMQERTLPNLPSIEPAEPKYYSHPTVHYIRDDSSALACTCFSSNSTGVYAEVLASSSNVWQQVYVKTAESVPAELQALPSVQRFFPDQSVRTIVAAEQADRKIFFKRFFGETLNDIRLRYHHGQGPLNCDPKGKSYITDEWFIDIELRRARDVLAAYESSLRLNDSSIACDQQKIHRFYHHRLQGNNRFRQFYGKSFPGFLGQATHETMSLEVLMDSTLVINGQSYQTIRHHLKRASEVLSPQRVGGLSSLPTAFGFGDGHGGNVMLSKDSITPSMLYVDYEVAGHHTPLLDLAKPIYQDGFFDVAYADLLSDDLAHAAIGDEATLEWRIEERSIHINYHLSLKPLSKGLAVIKLEYLLKPMLDALGQTSSYTMESAEEILAYGLLACALLTRDHTTRPDVFFFNVAIGVRLAVELRKVFSECFDWCNWPLRTPNHHERLRSVYTNIFSPETTPFSAEEVNRLESTCWENPTTKRHPAAIGSINAEDNLLVFNSKVRSFFENLDPTSMAENLPEEIHTLIRNYLSGMFMTVEADDVYLSREVDTFTLHQRFSDKPGEDAWMVTRRISEARKEAMRIAPHTCIRECLFAESRIDRHFVYWQVLSDVAETPTKTLIDVGCCMATDIRTLIAHGYPANRITGLDNQKGFMQLGFVLYNQSRRSLAAQFREADVLNPDFFDKCSDLANGFDFVHTANVIHLYDEAQQETILRALAFLVKPGGMIWGRQVGIKEDDAGQYRQPEGKGVRFTASQFRQLWAKATGWIANAEFEACLVPYDELRSPRADKQLSMQWRICAPLDKSKNRFVELN